MLGGVVLEYLSWHWIFFVNVPIGVLALVLGSKLVSRSEPQPGDPLDLCGLTLLSPGLAGIVFGLSETSNGGGFGYVGAWLPILVGAALMTAFVSHALRLGDRRPLFDLTLFRSPAFAAAAIAVLLTAASTFGGLLLFPLYFQVDRGTSTLATGLLLAPQGLGAACAMPISGRRASAHRVVDQHRFARRRSRRPNRPRRGLERHRARSGRGVCRAPGDTR